MAIHADNTGNQSGSDIRIYHSHSPNRPGIVYWTRICPRPRFTGHVTPKATPSGRQTRRQQQSQQKDECEVDTFQRVAGIHLHQIHNIKPFIEGKLPESRAAVRLLRKGMRRPLSKDYMSLSDVPNPIAMQG